MLEAREIRKSFKGHSVLKGTSLSLENSSLSGLIGPSGGGKSVLLKILGSVVRPDSGEVSRNSGGEASISLMFQEGALFDSLSVFDNVAFPLVSGKVPASSLKGAVRDEVQEKVTAVLGRVGLTKAAHKMPAQLSGGMRRRVSLARALVARPRLVLLDDPTAGLDPVASSVIMNLIVELHREYLPTTLMVSHDLRRLFPVVDKIHALFNGQICFSGTLEELKQFEDPLLRRFASCRYDLDG
ncbi:MAG: ATP-binding cassette domain-containing protein [Deltaproteobacteria bacterium]|nr:ATP-binding cassette domain-containing protein [Deltaproteobacteria bacterium]